jgi:hypothetical protein
MSLTPLHCGQFGYVYDYDTSDTVVDCVQLVRGPPPDGEDTAYTPGQTLPSKDPLLICRQLYAETKKMQVACFRDYWQTNIFVIDAMDHRHSPASPNRQSKQEIYAQLTPRDLVANENLKHVRRIAFCMNAYWESYFLSFTFNDNGAWDVCLLLPREEAQPRALIRYIFPQGSKIENLERTLTELNARVGDEAIRNPSRGRGFTAFRLFEFMSLLRHRFVEF